MKKLMMVIFLISTLIINAAEVGAKRALEDSSLTVEKMLTYALQDEYLAKNEYLKIMEKFGSVRPYTNIKRSEETHINALLPLFEKYKVKSVSEEEMAKLIVVPGDLRSSAEAGIQAEIDNIAMYEKFLKEKNLPQDITEVFIFLKAASENHLAAFKRQL